MRTVSRSAVPALTTEQMRAVDRAMVDDLHIELVQMMENAGRSLADISVPPLVYQRMGIAVPELFRQSSLLRIGPSASSAPLVR